jgi:Protein of unknown function (DUF2510)
MNRERNLLGSGGALLVIGIFGAWLTYSNHSVCSSSIGAIAQGLSKNAAIQCTLWSGAFYLSVLAAIAGVALLVIGMVLQHLQGGLPGTGKKLPGWYRDQMGVLRWWDGRTWTNLKQPEPPIPMWPPPPYPPAESPVPTDHWETEKR